MFGVADQLGDRSVKKKMKLDFALWSKRHVQRNAVDGEHCRGGAFRLQLGGPPEAAAVGQRKCGRQRVGFPGYFSGEILDLDFIHRVPKLGGVRALRWNSEGLRAKRFCFRGKAHFKDAFRMDG